tara:strand:- start:40 stop:501 length:462 start_codon:yes stop_codon:yes gene_type:complete
LTLWGKGDRLIRIYLPVSIPILRQGIWGENGNPWADFLPENPLKFIFCRKGLTDVDESLAKQCVDIVEWHYSSMKGIMSSVERKAKKDDLEKLTKYIDVNGGKVHKRRVHVNLRISEATLSGWMDDGDLEGFEEWKEDGKKVIGRSKEKPETE